MRFVPAVVAVALLSGCSSDSSQPSSDAGDLAGDVTSDVPDSSLDTTDALEDVDSGDVARDVPNDVPPPPDDAYPCTDGQYWPFSIASAEVPVRVHYRPGEEAVAEEVLGYVETAWTVEVNELGFSAPLPDGGACGPDDRFDVFIWAGIIESYVDIIDENPDTVWDDRLSYLVIDPFGPYGGEVLDATVAHELNHACQAADDWWDAPIVFEMTSTFMEDVVFDDDDSWMALLEDFQTRPDWSLDYDDEYETWYMYAASLYLMFLREHVFDGDAGFAAQMWQGLRNPPGADEDPSLNEPDFEDALDAILTEAGTSFLDSVETFARWRWYTGSRDDGAHFEEGASFPESALVTLAADVAPDAGTVAITPLPMLLGNGYVRVSSTTADDFSVALEAPENANVRWVVQALPGLEAGSDGEALDLSGGPVRVALTEDGERVLVVTALPAGEDDPDTRVESRFPVSLVIGE